MDLFRAPFVFVGTLTSIDSLCQSQPTLSSAVVMKLELSDVQSVHKHYDKKLADKGLAFLWTGAGGADMPSWIIDPNKDIGDDWGMCDFGESGLDIEAPDHDFIIGKRYIVFLSAENNNFGCALGTGFNLLPSLEITALKNKCFPVEGTQVVDVNRYFGKGESVEFSEVESLLNSVLDEIFSWTGLGH